MGTVLIGRNKQSVAIFVVQESRWWIFNSGMILSIIANDASFLKNLLTFDTRRERVPTYLAAETACRFDFGSIANRNVLYSGSQSKIISLLVGIL